MGRLSARVWTFAAIVAVAVVVVWVQLTAPVCGNCPDPNRPYSLECGDNWNPTTSQEGFVDLACASPGS